MADLSDIQAAQTVKITGSDSTGTEQVPVQSTANGALHNNLRDSTGNELLGQKTMANSVPVVLPSDQNIGTVIQGSDKPTFSVNAVGIAIANNKSLLSLVNASGSTVRVKIKEIWIRNAQTSGVTGVVGQFQLKRITNHSAGTSLTFATFETSDSLDSSVTARTGSTVSGESSTSLRRWFWSTDEWGPGAPDVESNDHAFQNLTPHYLAGDSYKSITLLANEGISIKFATNSTAGSFDVEIIFTQE